MFVVAPFVAERSSVPPFIVSVPSGDNSNADALTDEPATPMVRFSAETVPVVETAASTRSVTSATGVSFLTAMLRAPAKVLSSEKTAVASSPETLTVPVELSARESRFCVISAPLRVSVPPLSVVVAEPSAVSEFAVRFAAPSASPMLSCAFAPSETVPEPRSIIEPFFRSMTPFSFAVRLSSFVVSVVPVLTVSVPEEEIVPEALLLSSFVPSTLSSVKSLTLTVPPAMTREFTPEASAASSVTVAPVLAVSVSTVAFPLTVSVPFSAVIAERLASPSMTSAAPFATSILP